MESKVISICELEEIANDIIEKEYRQAASDIEKDEIRYAVYVAYEGQTIRKNINNN